MSYSAFGKVKTIVLPIPGSEMTLDEYRNKYGIDLKEFIRVDSTRILLDFGCANVLLKVSKEYGEVFADPKVSLLSVINSSSVYPIDAETDAITRLSSNVVYACIEFVIGQGQEMKIDNVHVRGNEL